MRTSTKIFINHIAAITKTLASVAFLMLNLNIAQATPIRYDCGAGAGDYSRIKIPRTDTNHAVVTKISAVDFDPDKDWYPTSNISIFSRDEQDAFGVTVRRLDSKAPIELVLVQIEHGSVTSKVLADVRVGQAAQVRLESVNGRSIAIVGGKSIDVGRAIEAGGYVQVSCSSGDFLFDALDWEASPSNSLTP